MSDESKGEENAPTVLPCPFCGRAPHESNRESAWTGTGKLFTISCHCGEYAARAHQMAGTREAVLRKWNTRAPIAAAK